MARHRSPHKDPAADAAALLRRLGFATLVVALPIAALVTRRGVVVLAPIGIVLLALAALLDGEHRRLARSLSPIVGTRTGLAGLVGLGFAVLSLAWTPFPVQAADRATSLLATLALGLVGYCALPDRMRSANLYPLAIGVAAAASIAVVMLLVAPWPAWDEATETLDRGIVALTLLSWPAAAWLHSRGRDLEAMGMVLVVAVACGLAPTHLAFSGFVTGAIVYLVAASRLSIAGRLVAGAAAAALLLAPAFVLALGPHLGLPSLEAWRGMILADPLRLVTGYGFETALRGRGVGLVPEGAPGSSLFEIWIDFGLVGAVALATLVAGAALGLARAEAQAARAHAQVAPGALAGLACAFAIFVAGLGPTQMWWVTTLVVAAIAFTAVERGQFRTQRPKAILNLLLRRERPPES